MSNSYYKSSHYPEYATRSKIIVSIITTNARLAPASVIFLNGFNTAEESDHYMNLLSMASAVCSPGTIFSLGIVGLVNYDELSFVLLWRIRQAVLLSSISVNRSLWTCLQAGAMMFPCPSFTRTERCRFKLGTCLQNKAQQLKIDKCQNSFTITNKS